MKTVNKVTLLGHLGRDVELRYTLAGEAVASCQVATSAERKEPATGQRPQATEWHRCVAFGKLAELIARYCRRGSAVYFEGKLRHRQWTDKDGVDQHTTEIVVEEFISLDKRDGEPVTAHAMAPAPSRKPTASPLRETAH